MADSYDYSTPELVRLLGNRVLPKLLASPYLIHKEDMNNNERQLHIQLVCNEPKAFQGILANYGKYFEYVGMNNNHHQVRAFSYK